jgi:aryl-alcohol dehydrogenase-like predicted oxidoreductase
MQHRRVGESGLKVSAIALGSQTTFVEMRQSGVREVVRAAVEHGITTFDMADVYDKGEAERLFGYVVSGLRRQDVVIISKVGQPMTDSVLDRGLSRKHILESIDGALVRLQTEYLDLYLCDGYDPETPVAEVAGAMDQLVRSGKILYWGTRGWSAAQIESALAASRAMGGSPPMADQSPYNLLDRRAEVDGSLAPGLAGGVVGVMACHPLAGGVLTGKYNDGIPRFSRAEIDETLRASLVEADLARVRGLPPIAADLGVTTAQLALAWVLTRPGVSCAVSGAMSSEQIAENAGAGELVLGAEVLAAVEGVVGG